MARHRGPDPTQAWNDAIDAAGQPGDDPAARAFRRRNRGGHWPWLGTAAVIRRGEVWWVDFGEPKGSMPGYRHPAVIVQRNEVNASRIDTVVVCVLTSNVALASAPGNVRLPRKTTGLPRDSVANASQIATINKTDLETLVGKLPPRVVREVDEGLRGFLGLGE